MKFIFAAMLVCLAANHDCRANASGRDSIFVLYSSLDTAVKHALVDASELPAILRNLPKGRDPELSIVVNEAVTTHHVLSGIGFIRDTISLTLASVTPGLVDSVLESIHAPNMFALGVTYRHGAAHVPAHLSRFPALVFLALEAIDGSFPCISADSVPNLEIIYVYGPLRRIECECTPGRRVAIGRFSEPAADFDDDRLFVITGIYSDDACVFDTFRTYDAEKFRDTIPQIGQRSFAVVAQGRERAAVATGVLERFLATVVARVRSGEQDLVIRHPTDREAFIARALDPRGTCTIEVHSDKVILYERFVYTGPLVPLMNNLLNEGCF
jgi:hypothetical protein